MRQFVGTDVNSLTYLLIIMATSSLTTRTLESESSDRNIVKKFSGADGVCVCVCVCVCVRT